MVALSLLYWSKWPSILGFLGWEGGTLLAVMELVFRHQKRVDAHSLPSRPRGGSQGSLVSACRAVVWVWGSKNRH